jgi:hypothetical protein
VASSPLFRFATLADLLRPSDYRTASRLSLIRQEDRAFRHPDEERSEAAAREREAAERAEKRLRIVERRRRIGRVVRVVVILAVVLLAAIAVVVAGLLALSWDPSDERYRQWGRGR